jgi:ribosomal protein L12E/L44/L45/RPP1/RPP2
VTDGKKMEGSCSTGRSPQWAVVPVEEEEEEEGEEEEEEEEEEEAEEGEEINFKLLFDEYRM